MGRKVLLVTTVEWTSTARYAGGFVAAAWTVEALCPRRAPAAVSRYVSASHRYRPLMALSSLHRAIAKSAPDLVVPCDDRAVGLLLRLYRKQLKARGENAPIVSLLRRSLGSPESFDAILPRAVSMRTAAQLGIRTPEILALANESELSESLDRIGLPAVLKADGSWGGEGVSVVRTREEAVAAFRHLLRPASRLRNVARAFKRKDAHFLREALRPAKQQISIQKFVAGRSAASAFACWQGEVVGRIYYDVLVSDGPGGPPNVIRRIDCPQIDEASRKVAKHFGLSGIYGLDFIRDDAGDVHLIEINPRTTQGGTLAFGEGRDLPAALAGCVTRSEATRRPAIANDVVAFFPREWQRDAASPYLLGGHHDVPWDDAAILRMCVDSVPEADPARKSLLEMLALPAGRRDTPIWRRALAFAKG